MPCAVLDIVISSCLLRVIQRLYIYISLLFLDWCTLCQIDVLLAGVPVPQRTAFRYIRGLAAPRVAPPSRSVPFHARRGTSSWSEPGGIGDSTPSGHGP